MLLLNRKVGESIVVNDDIEIKVKKISGSRVRVSISAPKNVRIRRGELIEWVQEETHLEGSQCDASEQSLSCQPCA